MPITRREVLGALAVSPLLAADDGAAKLAGLIRKRKATWKSFDPKAAKRFPSPAAPLTDRLLGDPEEWRLRAQLIPKDLWQPLPCEPYSAPKPLPGGNGPAVGYKLIDLTASYLGTGDQLYADQAIAAMKVASQYVHWGRDGKAKDTDLDAGAILMGSGMAYSTMYPLINAADRKQIADKLVAQGKLMYDFHSAHKVFKWDQNHTYIALGGLWCAAVALHDEVADADKWYQFSSRALRNEAFLLNEPDGAFYEGPGYWNFGFAEHGLPVLDMFRNVTGEDVFGYMTGLREFKRYITGYVLPNGTDWLNSGDAGANTRAAVSLDRARYALLKYASEYRDPESQFLAGYFGKAQKMPPANDPWTLAYWDPSVQETDPFPKWSPMHRFSDLDLVILRDNWTADATHCALRCGPPLGHRMTRIYMKGELPDWSPETGHEHPDLNAFTIFDHGQYLAVDTGYTWEKKTRDHSTITVDGAGQTGDGQRWPSYAPFDRFAHIADYVALPGEHAYLCGSAAQAYESKLELNRFDRHMTMACGAEGNYFLIHDVLASAKPHDFGWLLIAINEAKASGERRWTVENGDRAMTVHLLQPTTAEFSQERVKVVERPMPGSDQPRGYRLSFHAPALAAVEYLVAITLHPKGSAGARVSESGGIVTVSGDRWTDTHMVRGNSGAAASSGHHTSVRRVGSQVVRWSSAETKSVTVDGKKVLDASEPVTVTAGERSVVMETRTPGNATLISPSGKTQTIKFASGRTEVLWS